MNNRTTCCDRDIAIVGMAARFPGADDTATFWKNLLHGKETIATFTEDELRASGIDEETIASPQYIRRRGILGNAADFDASFFDITPRDAEIMDPQHRLFLECCWHAFEDAGYVPQTYPGSVGVFGGTGTAWHLYNVNTHPDVQRAVSGASVVTNNDKDYVTTRVSYKLNLTGPSVNVQTACSTAMVAVVTGVNSLLSGESNLVVAGGVSLDLPERRGYRYMQGGMESADGRCYAFDARANGTVFSRGAGAVILKRLRDARRDGDHIYAVIKGGAINNDGNRKAGYTAPGIDGQMAAARRALGNALVHPDTLSFVEAHGTATALGDPIEFTSLRQTFREYTDKTQYCRLGSVKTNIGHTDAASGAASLIKTALALKNGQLPASLHYISPNPAIDFATSPFVMNTTLSALPAADHPHRALVNSFGVGGTNACVILEAPPPQGPDDRHDGLIMLPLSAKSRSALDAIKQRLHTHLLNHSELNLADVAWTLQVGRQPFAYSTVLVGTDRDALLEKLARPSAVMSTREPGPRPIVFMFPGQGNQYLNMARELYATYAVFSQVMDRCCRYLEPILGVNVTTIIFADASDENASRLNETRFTQPALFIVEYSLAQLWISWGIRPDAMIGHSVGEYVAACIAGVFSLEDALRAVALRGKRVQALPAGAMLAVMMDEASLRQRLQGSSLDIAAVNYPALCVVSGEVAAVAAFQRQLEADNLFCKPLETSHGFHSSMMEPALADFRAVIDGITLHAPTVPFVSTVSGDWITAAQATDSDYWVKHVREPVLFSHAFKTLKAGDYQRALYLEVGPGCSLASAARQHCQADDSEVIYASLPGAKQVASTAEQMLTTLGCLWAHGVEIDWRRFYGEEQRRRLPLPGYPFERKTFALPPLPQGREGQLNAHVLNARKQKKANIGDWFWLPGWKRTVPASRIAGKCIDADDACWLLFIDAMVIAEHIQRQLAASGQRVVVVWRGSQYEDDVENGCYAIDPAQRDDYFRLMQSLKHHGLRPTRIITLWNLSANSGEPQIGGSTHALQIDAFYSPLHLQQALVSENLLDDLRLVFVTNNIFGVTAQRLDAPQKALVTGPARVFYHEYPDVYCHVVDVDLFGYPAPDDIARHLIAECHINTHGQRVAYRGGHRWEEDYQPVYLKQDDTGVAAALKDDGVYLITGGTGGLGMMVANHISLVSNASLILTYRRALPPRDDWPRWLQQHPVDDALSQKIAGIMQLEARGNTVHLAQVDVCDISGMRELLANFPHIDDVFHAAGMAGGGIIPLKTDADCAVVLDPKVVGSLVLDELLADKQPDFFILFSSITAIVGDEARIDYCAANAFLDAFALYRNQQRTGRTVAVNWGRWGDVGMAVNWGKQQSEKRASAPVAADKGDLLTLIACEGLQENYQINLAAHRDWVIDEHRLAHQPSLVGTAILSMLYAWMSRFRPEELLQVKNLLLTQPVIFHHGWPRSMQLCVTVENGGYAFSLRSRGILDTDWQQHALGAISRIARKPHAVPVEMAVIRQRCTQALDWQPLPCELGNANTGDVFLSLSARWNNHQESWQGENEWLIHKVLGAEYHGDLAHYPFHPAMIDATAICCLSNITTENFLPISYGKITFHAPLTADCYAHVTLKQPYQPHDSIITMNIVFLSATGVPLLTLENYALVKITADNQIATPGTAPAGAVKVNLADSDILLDEGRDALRRLLAHLEFEQLVVVTRDLEQLIDESIPTPRDAAPERDLTAEGHGRPALSVEYQAPENDIEKAIVGVWQSVLGIAGIGINDNFTELGGNSLLAVQAGSTIAGLFDIDIRVDLFYQNQTVSGLAALIVAELDTLLQGDSPDAPGYQVGYQAYNGED